MGSEAREKSFKLFWMEKVISLLESQLQMRFLLPVYRDIATVTPLDTLLAAGPQELLLVTSCPQSRKPLVFHLWITQTTF